MRWQRVDFKKVSTLFNSLHVFTSLTFKKKFFTMFFIQKRWKNGIDILQNNRLKLLFSYGMHYG